MKALNPCLMLKKNYIDYVTGHIDPYCVNTLKTVKEPGKTNKNFNLDHMNI